jgi:hypothetical protein
MPENRQLTTADWNEAKKLLTLSEPELHKLGLDELREGAALLRAVGDLCVRRSRGLHKLADGREAVGAVVAPKLAHQVQKEHNPDRPCYAAEESAHGRIH